MTRKTAAGTKRPVPGRPPRAPRSHQVKPGAQAPAVGKGTTAPGKPTGAPTGTGPDEARRTTRGHEAHQRGTSPATTKAHGQVPSSDRRRVPQTRRARTTRNGPRHEDRCQGTPAAVQTDVCAPGTEPSPCRLRNSRRPDGRVCARSVPSPCRLRTDAARMDECASRGYPAPAGYEQPPSGWTSARLEGTQPLPATNSHRPDGRVSAPQRPLAHTTHSTRQ